MQNKVIVTYIPNFSGGAPSNFAQYSVYTESVELLDLKS